MSIEDATNPVAPVDDDIDFGAADLAKVPEVLALAVSLHFEAGLRADVAVNAAEQQLGIGYCGDAVRNRLYELGLAFLASGEEAGE